MWELSSSDDGFTQNENGTSEDIN